jgi:hypothetical protein
MNLSPDTPLVDGQTCAKALGKSLAWLRKDRITKRLVPFVKIGSEAKYDLDAVRRAFVVEGGPA